MAGKNCGCRKKLKRMLNSKVHFEQTPARKYKLGEIPKASSMPKHSKISKARKFKSKYSTF